jgi:hypothetical protein
VLVVAGAGVGQARFALVILLVLIQANTIKVRSHVLLPTRVFSISILISLSLCWWLAGAGVGQARFALVILLVLLAGKYRGTIELIPELLGFSIYQVGIMHGFCMRNQVHCASLAATEYEPGGPKRGWLT